MEEILWRTAAFAFGGALAWKSLVAVRAGIFEMAGGDAFSPRRTEEPVGFWCVVGFNLLIAALFFWFALLS